MKEVEAESIRVVFITVPRDEVSRLARELVEQRLAACINIVPKIESYFWWEDAVQHDEEALLICKTTEEKFRALMEYTQESHPYDLPEIISFPLSDGLPEYLAWVRKETEG
ncbi:MAG: divalent-cation tolerance protein CutA [Candidatus Zixiibacteriota bacterium]